MGFNPVSMSPLWLPSQAPGHLTWPTGEMKFICSLLIDFTLTLGNKCALLLLAGRCFASSYWLAMGCLMSYRGEQTGAASSWLAAITKTWHLHSVIRFTSFAVVTHLYLHESPFWVKTWTKSDRDGLQQGSQTFIFLCLGSVLHLSNSFWLQSLGIVFCFVWLRCPVSMCFGAAWRS